MEPGRDGAGAPGAPWQATAAILAGGASRRMGCDKRALRLSSQTLLERRLADLAPLFPDLLVVSDDWRELPLGRARGVSDRRVPGAPTGRAGPLTGLAAALAAARHPWVFVTAVDMPFTRRRLLAHLLELASGASSAVDAVVPEAAGGRGIEPLCALYHRRVLPRLDARLAAGALALQAAARSLRLHLVPEVVWRPLDPDGRTFWNVNTPEDLERARAADEDPEPPGEAGVGGVAGAG